VRSRNLSTIALWAMAMVFVLCALWLAALYFGIRVPEAQADESRTVVFVAPKAPAPTLAPAFDSPGFTQDFGAGSAQNQRGNAELVSAAWAATAAAQTGVPLRAVIAYAGAATAMASIQPQCHVDWVTLAALGNIESGHGTHAGSRIDDAGIVRPAIYGPLLDGIEYGSVINDTDKGRFDGNNLFDRAVGPMQFIPTTWAKWGHDGNGDGFPDPQQIDDSALTTAYYLCHYGDLSDGQGWRAAIFGYNHLESYVDSVASMASTYLERLG
jgi:membrane-bound lytic murein transglycosylase B